MQIGFSTTSACLMRAIWSTPGLMRRLHGARSRRRCSKPMTALRAPRQESVPAGRVVDDIGPVEGWAEHGGLRYLPAIAAADAGVVDRRHRIVPQRVVVCLTESDGQPDSRMQAWSPVQTSSSTPKRSRTMRRPSLTALENKGFTRRCLFSMHSDEATMIFGPSSVEVSASLSVSRILATSYVRSISRTHLAPMPFTAFRDRIVGRAVRILGA